MSLFVTAYRKNQKENEVIPCTDTELLLGHISEGVFLLCHSHMANITDTDRSQANTGHIDDHRYWVYI